ncbi:DNA gyrase subunit A [Ruminococcaceae bacterium YRB3002]|nr:DNA gyrase subunit A [Ruminococcaceae bacterium YRB3002]
MADNKELRKQQEAQVDEVFKSEQTTIVPVDLDKEMRKSFIDYAMSVISDRALPDIRDGMKPVHRRILYSMFTLGFTPDKPYRKCATTIGDVLGRFHPHGDASVYDALVRLAQDFSLRHPLVDGHGNFGSIDGDPPAAYRYTEARLDKIALEMMRDINKNTVDFRPNFDEHDMEPVALPSRFPNLLVNGSVGIAVGMATNIPPHNLGEVIDGVVMMLDNPDCTIDDLMTVVKGPDFPLGGQILGTMGIREAYSTGRGRILVRAHCEIEDHQGRQRIIVHDLPFAVNKARLIERIAELAKDKKVEGVTNVRDESDRNEKVRIVIDVKKDSNPEVVLNQLYKNCALQDACCANMLALVPDKDGKLEPKLITLRDALSYYVEHQETVVTRRTEFDKEKDEGRRHIDEGLLIAMDHIDEIIAIIRSSRTEAEAKDRMCERFGFTDKQAQHIVDMRLGRLTGLEREKLEAEIAELNARIEQYIKILSDKEVLHDVIKTEILEIKRKFATPRVSEIVNGSFEDIDDESLIQEEDIVVTLTHMGYIKRQRIDTYKAQHRGGRGISGQSTREEDYVEKIITTTTHKFLLCFTDTGRVFKIKGYKIPETTSRSARGTAIVNLLKLGENEKITNIIPIDNFEDNDLYLTVATKNGTVKRTAVSKYVNINKNGLIATNIREDDAVIAVSLVRGKQEIILVTSSGKAIRFNSDDCRELGRSATGVRGIRLSDGDHVIGMEPVTENGELLVISENGYGKRSSVDDYKVQNRGGKGLITYKVSEKTGNLIGVTIVNNDDDLLIITDQGVIIRVSAAEIPTLSRATSGVRLMRSRNAKIVDFALTEHEAPEEGEEAGEISVDEADLEPQDDAPSEPAEEADAPEASAEAEEPSGSDNGEE